MQADYSQYWTFPIAALAVFLIYRRFRRNFGRQLLSPARMRVRMAILVVMGCLLLPSALVSVRIIGADVAGLAAGIGLAFWGAQRTRYQTHAGRLHYVPHTYTGVAVSLLFIGRLMFRFWNLHSMNDAGATGSAMDPSHGLAPSMMVKSPLTFGLFYVLVGYYVCYYALVLRKSRHLGPEDIEEEPSTAAPT